MNGIEESDGTWMVGTSSKGRHSLDSLMNPCQYKTTGICTCCKTDTVKEEGKLQSEQKSGQACCDEETCCSESLSGPSCSSKDPKFSSDSCCSGGGSATKQGQILTSTMDTPVSASLPDTSRQATDLNSLPSCHCGPNCSCPGCVNESVTSRQERAKMTQNEECPEKCLTCSACVFGLMRPSGIEAVDDWIEQDKQRIKPVVESGVVKGDTSNKRVKISVEDLGKAVHSTALPLSKVSPPLPPFPNAASFYSSHFMDPERRNHFADQLRGSHCDSPTTVLPTHEEGQEQMEYGKRLEGESDEEWQIRHGFYYLTPEAIRIFDSARKFKEERK